jgi:hypothetical protein
MLDTEMIGYPAIHPRRTPWRDISHVADLEAQLRGRYLLKYVHPDQVGAFASGADWEQYATPTPYSPSEAVPYLALPRPTTKRMYVLLLDPSKLRDVKGPRWVTLGQGIEYLLESGFSPGAIVSLSPDAPATWEMEIR